MSYQVKISAFEGPLDLLLHLIDKNKIDLYNIPMAELTRQYMVYIEESQEFNIEVATEFLVMAAKLLNIKSKMLLPVKNALNDSDEIAEDSDDPRDELVQHLLTYQKFQLMSERLLKMLSAEEKFIKRPPMKLSQKVLPPQNLSVEKLIRAFAATTSSSEDLVIPEVLVSPENFSVKEKMADIMVLLENNDELKLSKVVTTKNVSEFVTSFLALLELVKRHKVKAEQLIPFAEIIIRHTAENEN